MSRGTHPDHAEASKKREMTQKFQLLGKIRDILTEGDKRSTYDRHGIVSLNEPRAYIVSDEDMIACKKYYKGMYTFYRHISSLHYCLLSTIQISQEKSPKNNPFASNT